MMLRNLTYIFLLFWTNSSGQTKIDGVFVGIKRVDFDRLGGTERAQIEKQKLQKKGTLFYKVSFLKIKEDSAFLDKKAISVRKKDTTLLTDDGICHYFSGRLMKQGDVIKFSLNEVVVNFFEANIQRDSAGFLHVLPRCSEDPVGHVRGGGIVIDNMLFERKHQDRQFISENPGRFKNRDW